MRLSGSRRPIHYAVAGALAWLAIAGGGSAQQVDVQPQASERQSNDNDDERDDEEPRTVQAQIQAVKRELRGAKADPSQTAPVRDGGHQFSLKVPNYVAIRQRNIVMQQRDFSCGAACFATICRYYWGDNVTEDMVLTALDLLLTAEETEDRIKNLRRAAVRMGYQSVVGKTSFVKLGELKVPVIVGIQPGGHKHFVVLRGTFGDYVYMADPIRGNVRMPNWEFVEQWQENAILVIHKPGEKVKKFSALSLTDADVGLGELNDQIIRSQEARQPQYRVKLGP
jgi:predicted double-glycine peptidase